MSELKQYINVEVIYAGETQQRLVPLRLPLGSLVEEALQQSSLWTQFPELEEYNLPVGIFGKVCKLDDELKEGDRVEIYRPLKIDPKRKRELLAKKRKK